MLNIVKKYSDKVPQLNMLMPYIKNSIQQLSPQGIDQLIGFLEGVAGDLKSIREAEKNAAKGHST